MACALGLATSLPFSPLRPRCSAEDSTSSSGYVRLASPGTFQSPLLRQGRHEEVGADLMSVMYPAFQNANLMWFNRPSNATVLAGENESPESIVRRFRREVMNEGIIAECRHRRHFETTQDIRKRKQQTNRRRRAASRRFSGGPRPAISDPFSAENKKRALDDDDDNWGDSPADDSGI